MLPKVFYAREGREPKELTPSSQKELDALIRIGWKIKGESNELPPKAV